MVATGVQWSGFIKVQIARFDHEVLAGSRDQTTSRSQAPTTKHLVTVTHTATCSEPGCEDLSEADLPVARKRWPQQLPSRIRECLRTLLLATAGRSGAAALGSPLPWREAVA
jgi:hypothetical protein